MRMTVLIALIVIIIGIAAGLIFMQYKLCTTENGKKSGLILPIVSFIVSAVCSVIVFVFTAVNSTSTHEVYHDEQGNIIQSEIVEEETDISSAIPGAVGAFLFTNIPTVIFLVEYALVTSGRKKSELKADEMAKTQIQDL